MKVLKGILMVMVSILLSFTLWANESSGEMAATKGDFIAVFKDMDTENRLNNVVGNQKDKLTREEVATLIVKLFGYEGIASDYQKTKLYSDVNTHCGEINLIASLGILSGTGNNKFAPSQPITINQLGVIKARIENKLNNGMQWRHAFYAISSYAQKDYIKSCDAVSFGWAEMNYNEETNKFFITTNGKNFKLPNGFEEIVDIAQQNQVETYLMIYFEDNGVNAQKLFTDEKMRAGIVADIVQLTNGVTKEGNTRVFDGITIDFEGFASSELQKTYVTFLEEVRAALKANNKKLLIAVQPNTYYKGYDYKNIAVTVDHIIIMAHDYSPKRLSENERNLGMTTTPVSPINEVYKTLSQVIGAVEDKNKVALQICFSSLQWQSKEDIVIHENAYTPSYDKIEERILDESASKLYSEYYQNPYITYTIDGTNNIIWYENRKSVQTKMNLAKLLSVQAISYWRLGTIPSDCDSIVGK